ncbi:MULTISPECIES: hypothetical protein [Burkholderia]|uniref:hypothetical protein n=1 Tax=Burkholderia sp. RF4-BP95 TaxID=1637845 RepID=UPI0015D0A51C|nr:MULTISPECIES: hypothetical protein [Burkholderia]
MRGNRDPITTTGAPMKRSSSLDTDSHGQDRGDSTPGPEGKRHGTDTPPPRSARDPAEGKPQAPDERRPAQLPDAPAPRTRARRDTRQPGIVHAEPPRQK